MKTPLNLATKSIIFLLLSALLASCAGTVTPTVVTPQATVTPSPTATLIPPPTATATPIPPTSTPIPIGFSEGAEKGLVEELKRFGTGNIFDAQYSPTGNLIAFATYIGVFVYDTTTYDEVGFFPSDTYVTRVAFTPDGEKIAFGSNGNVVIWNIKEKELVTSFKAHTAYLFAIAISPDGRYLATSGSDGKGERVELNEVSVWNTNDWSPIRSNRIGYVTRLRFTPDSNMLLAVADDRIITMVPDGWGMSGLIQELIPVGGNVFARPTITDIAITPDGKSLAVSYDRYSIIGLFNLPSTRLKQLVLIEPDENQQPTMGGIGAISFSSTGEELAFCKRDSAGIIEITNDGAKVLMVSGDGGTFVPGSFIRFSPAEDLLTYDLSVYYPRILLVKDKNAYPLPELGNAANIFVEHGVFPSGNWKVEVDDEKGIVMLTKKGDAAPAYAVEAHTPTVLAIFGHRSYFTVGDIAVAPGESFFVTGGYDGQVYLWQVTEEPNNKLLGHPGKGIHSVAISPDETLVAAGDEDGKIFIWNIAAEEPKIVLELEHANDFGSASNVLNSLAFSPDGKVLVSGGDATSIKIWRVSDGTLLGTLPNNMRIEAMQFSEDGTILYSKSQIDSNGQGVVRWWGVKQ